VKELQPDTVRIMLTGNADLESAIKVVNEGNIFRFLTKPCPPEILGKAVDDACAQFRLVIAEKELLNKTLSGSIKLLTDILSIFDPPSFVRAQAQREIISSLSHKFKVGDEWAIHLAIMLAPIAAVTVPPETLLRARTGQPLTNVEEQILVQLPETAGRLLANIPRLENVGRIVRYHHKRYDGSGFPADKISGDSLPFGARLLKILGDLAHLQAGGLNRVRALDEMQSRFGWYDPALLDAVRHFYGLAAAAREARPSISVNLNDLAPGMVLQSEILTKDGLLIITAGHHITEMTLEKIKNFGRLSGIKEPIFVEAPENFATA
jgi:response regulator RpfG family c-di-GMP phosphodiesterase